MSKGVFKEVKTTLRGILRGFKTWLILLVDKAKGPFLSASGTSKPALSEPSRLARGPVLLSLLSDRIAKPALGKRGFAGGDIISRWSVIVGEELAAFACPLEIKYPRGRNDAATLHLRVSNGAAATLLQFKSPAIIERINRFFGYQVVAKISATQGPLPNTNAARVTHTQRPLPPGAEESIAQTVSTIASPGVRAALARLGLALRRRENR